jgi:hypothetical protein
LGANCAGTDPRAALKLTQGEDYGARSMLRWRQASNVELVRVPMCSAARSQVSAALKNGGLSRQIAGAVSQDALISASLGRTHYDAGDVLAVHKSGSKLVVYVY